MNLTVIDQDTGTIYWTATQCAAHVGVARDTYTSYASRKQAPRPTASFEGHSLWDAEEVKAWHAARPGSPVPGAPTARRD